MRTRIVILAVIAGVILVGVGVAIATPSSGVTAETVGGDVTTRVNVNTRFTNGAHVKLKLSGPVEFIVQRIEAAPGATFGWHSHPGENINVVKQGTLFLYHDESCTTGTPYGPGAVLTTSPNQIHLARNLSETETIVLFATYFAPKTTPRVVRVDQPNPNPAVCPQ
jgi:quercetin dioxygenase-like cupin family protein